MGHVAAAASHDAQIVPQLGDESNRNKGDDTGQEAARAS